LNNNNYIIAHCQIINSTVYKNGEQLFKSWATNAQDVFTEIYQHLNLNYPKFYKMDGISKLGWLASEILLQGNGNIKQAKPPDVGLMLANTNASLDTDIKYLQTVHDFASPGLFVYTLPNIVAGEICIRNNFKGENAFFIFDEFNAAFTEQYVNYLLDNNILEFCICGWIEVLKESYKAVLFLAGKTPTGSLFSKENMNDIFNRPTF